MRGHFLQASPRHLMGQCMSRIQDWIVVGSDRGGFFTYDPKSKSQTLQLSMDISGHTLQVVCTHTVEHALKQHNCIVLGSTPASVVTSSWINLHFLHPHLSFSPSWRYALIFFPEKSSWLRYTSHGHSAYTLGSISQAVEFNLTAHFWYDKKLSR